LSESYFDRPFCIKELTKAVECGKHIVVCHTQATKPKLSDLFRKAAALGFPGIGSEESVELFLGDPEYAQVTLSKLKHKMRV
jgi:hypothetical protein